MEYLHMSGSWGVVSPPKTLEISLLLRVKLHMTAGIQRLLIASPFILNRWRLVTCKRGKCALFFHGLQLETIELANTVLSVIHTSTEWMWGLF